MKKVLLQSLAGLLLWVTTGSAAATVIPDYTLGHGDSVRVSVYGHPDLTTEERIGADGRIGFPLLGRVDLSGLTPPEAAQRIASGLERGGFVRSAHVSLRVTEFGSLTVSVLGEVNSAGRVILDRQTSLAEVIALAGGIGPNGGHRIVLLRTNDGRQQRQEYTLASLLQADERASGRLWVQPGDVIYVPPAEQFYVYGQVNRPGGYRLDRPLNVMQAISVGGGFNDRANTRNLVIFRKQKDGGVRELRARPNGNLQDGDVLFVRERLF